MIRYFFTVLIIITVLVFGLLFNVYYYPKSQFSETIKSFFPITFKTIIRDYVFIIPENNKTINNLEKFSLSIINEKNKINNSQIIKINSNEILNQNYELIKYKLPFYNRLLSNKTVAHLDSTNDHTYVVTGNGEFYYFLNENLKNKEFQINKIQNNLTDIIIDVRFFDYSKIFLNSDEISIKDILIYEDKMYISYIKEVTSNCFNTSILVAALNNKKLIFKNFFSYDECLSFKYQKEFNAQQSGGRIIKYKDSFLLTVGEYRTRKLAQDLDSNFGKILKINIKNNNKEIFSIGHRNPQGLLFDSELNIILSTEHGPYGGDEINLIKQNKNYGWPIASYGDHYDGKFRKDAPLHKSHKDYGFEEPLFYFYPAIGISEIVKIKKNNINNNFSYFISSLKDQSLFNMKINKEKTKLELEEIIKIGERIRDIIFIEKQNVYLMILENSPSLGILKINN